MKEDALIKEIGKILDELKLSLVTVESCTGGFLAYVLSSHEETSSNLERGYVTYSNQSKESLLEVNPETLQLHGAVSKEVAIEMAKGALKNSKAQISISTTGIAGSDIKGKKAGIAWIAFETILFENLIIKKEIKGTRKEFIQKTTHICLSELLNLLNKLS